MTPQTELGREVFRSLVRQRALIADSMHHLTLNRPVTADALRSLDRQERAELDALLHRMGRLQDYLGRQVFRTVLTVAFEDVPESMIDLLGQMERRGIVPDTEQWAAVRAARNALAHEYGADEERAARALDRALGVLPTVCAIADRAIDALAVLLDPKNPQGLVAAVLGSD